MYVWNLFKVQAKPGRQLAPSVLRDIQSPAVEILCHPFFLEGEFQQSCPQRTADVRPALAPIQARAREAATQFSSRLNIDAQSLKRVRAIRGEIVPVVSMSRTC